MTPRIFWLLCIILTLGTTAQARSKSTLRDAAAVFQAERMIDESTWSETIRIRNRRPDSTFDSRVWALAFEFGGRVWIYIPQIGTQSPAVRVDQLESDKADLSGLLAKVNPGFVSYDRVGPDEKIIAAVAKLDDVPNACLMESLATLRKMVRSGVDVAQADLLMYYAKVGSSMVGHTVLVYETDEGQFVWDPEKPKHSRRLNQSRTGTPLAMARLVADVGVRSKVAKAQMLNIGEADMGVTYMAGLDRRHFANLVN